MAGIRPRTGIGPKIMPATLEVFEAAGLDFVETEHLCAFDATPAFSLGQAQ